MPLIFLKLLPSDLYIYFLINNEFFNLPINKMGPKAAAPAPKASPAKKAEKASKVKKADKPKVKRAASPYIIFSTEKRPEVKAAHPSATFGELGKLLGQLWAGLDDKSKAVSYSFFIHYL